MRKKSKGDTWDGIFADPEVGRVLHANGLIADANKSSIKELATITSLSSYFKSNKVLTKFPELKYCTGLSSLYEAFRDCSNLTEAPIIPASVTNMGYTFYKCTNLTETPIIPEGVTSMWSTFTECRNLIEAPIIPESVTYMQATFRNCTSLDDIFIIKPVTPPTYYNTFQGASIRAIYVPDESVDSYKTAEGWSAQSSKIYPISELPE